MPEVSLNAVHSRILSKGGFGITVGLILLIACVRIISTYGLLSQTFDEPAHIAAGMELLQHRSYRYDPQHTPLARLAVAIGPYLAGARSPHYPDIWKEGNAILASGAGYWRNLTLARVGILPFFVLGGWMVWGVTRWLFGAGCALIATAFYSLLPPVLGHAGLATADMAGTAGYLAAVWAFLWWLEKPSVRRSAVLAVGVAAAVLTRLSSVTFLVVGLGAILIVSRSRVSLRWRSVVAFCGVLLLCIWACYGFDVSPVLDGAELARARTMGFGVHLEPQWQEWEYRMVSVPLPASAILRGVYRLAEHNGQGHRSYLFRENRVGGWWYFFLIVLAVKTPLGFLLLALPGLVLLLRDADWRRRAIAVAALAVLLVCSMSRIHLGVRHLLPMYPMLAIAAAYACAVMWRYPRWRAVPLLLAGWFVIASAMAHPDYMAYFNELAGSEPERILCESDLDWGQDLQRLSLRLHELGAREVKIAYSGTADLSAAGLPSYEVLQPGRPVTGYVAISVKRLQMEDASFGWLKSQRPLERIGKSILLYRL